MSHELKTRRQMLALTGSLAVAGLAGCSESSGKSGSGQPGTSTPTAGDGHTTDHEEEHEETNHEETNHEESETEGSHDDDHQDGESDGHDDHDHGTELPSGPSATATVNMQTENGGRHFSPHVVWVENGGTVTWNLESGSHDTVAYHPDNDKPRRLPEGADAWSSELYTDSGQTFEHTFQTEGVYDYCCTPHESMGMVGTVIVGEPDAHDQPALAEPQESLPDGARTELTTLNEKVNEALGHTH